MNLDGLQNNMLEDDIWKMAAVPENLWNLNRPRTLTMYKVGLTYTDKNTNITQKEVRNENVSQPRDDDVRSKVASLLASNFDPNQNISAAGIPATFTPPHASTPVPNRYKMKKR